MEFVSFLSKENPNFKIYTQPKMFYKISNLHTKNNQ